MARDLALADAYATSRRERKKIEMLFAHLKRILKLDRLRLRGPNGAYSDDAARVFQPSSAHRSNLMPPTIPI
jgi:hypothetical protein